MPSFRLVVNSKPVCPNVLTAFKEGFETTAKFSVNSGCTGRKFRMASDQGLAQQNEGQKSKYQAICDTKNFQSKLQHWGVSVNSAVTDKN